MCVIGVLVYWVGVIFVKGAVGVRKRGKCFDISTRASLFVGSNQGILPSAGNSIEVCTCILYFVFCILYFVPEWNMKLGFRLMIKL